MHRSRSRWSRRPRIATTPTRSKSRSPRFPRTSACWSCCASTPGSPMRRSASCSRSRPRPRASALPPRAARSLRPSEERCPTAAPASCSRPAMTLRAIASGWPTPEQTCAWSSRGRSSRSSCSQTRWWSAEASPTSIRRSTASGRAFRSTRPTFPATPASFEPCKLRCERVCPISRDLQGRATAQHRPRRQPLPGHPARRRHFSLALADAAQRRDPSRLTRPPDTRADDERGE